MPQNKLDEIRVGVSGQTSLRDILDFWRAVNKANGCHGKKWCVMCSPTLEQWKKCVKKYKSQKKGKGNG